MGLNTDNRSRNVVYLTRFHADYFLNEYDYYPAGVHPNVLTERVLSEATDFVHKPDSPLEREARRFELEDHERSALEAMFPGLDMVRLEIDEHAHYAPIMNTIERRGFVHYDKQIKEPEKVLQVA